jgi:hypothetical protein
LVTEIDFSGGAKFYPAFVTQTTILIVAKVPNTAVTGPVTLVLASGLKVAASSTSQSQLIVTAN